MSALKSIQEQYLSEEDVAALLEISVGTLRNRIYQGRNHPPFDKVGSTRCFPIEEFRAWLKSRRVREARAG